MEQTEISVEFWNSFSADFSRLHQGWLVTLAEIATDWIRTAPEQVTVHWQVISEQVHFKEILPGPVADSFIITAQLHVDGAILEYPLEGVEKIFRLTTDGADQGLRIDTRDSLKEKSTLIWFRSAALPEELDGIAQTEL